MKSQKLLCSMLLLACGLVLQVSCSQMEMERADSGRIVTRSDATQNIKIYWDGISHEIQVQFESEVGIVDAIMQNTNGDTIYNGVLDSSSPKHIIALDQLSIGDYSFVLTDDQGVATSLKFTIP